MKFILFIVLQVYTSLAFASVIDMKAIPYEQLYPAMQDDCSQTDYIHCTQAVHPYGQGSAASCMKAGSLNYREVADTNPGVYVWGYDWTNNCGQNVNAKLMAANQWSQAVVITPGAHAVILVAYSEQMEIPNLVNFELTATPAPNPNPNPQPAPVPVQRPISSQRPGQCMPGMGSSNIPGHSVINLERQSVSESIPIVGAPFYLNYSSDRLKKDSEVFKAASIGGWKLSIQHFLDTKNMVIYLGDGRVHRLKAPANWLDDQKIWFPPEKIDGYSMTFNRDGNIRAITGGFPIRKIWIFEYERSYLYKVTNDVEQTFTINKFGIVTPAGQKTELSYDSNGNLSKVTNPNNESYNLTADHNGRLTVFQKPSGIKTFISYDEAGNLLKDQGPLNTLSLSAHLTSENNALNVEALSSSGKFLGGVLVESKYNSSNVVYKSDYGALSSSYSETGEYSLVTSFYNDIYGGRLASRMDNGHHPNAGFSTFSEFTVDGSSFKKSAESWTEYRFEKVKGGDPKITEIEYVVNQNDKRQKYKLLRDMYPDVSVLTSPLGRTFKTTGTAISGKLTTQVADQTPSVLNFKKMKLTNWSQGDRQQSFAYDNFGNLISVVDSLGRKNSFEYDKANRPVRQTLPDGNSVDFSYDVDGNLTSLKPPGRSNHSFVIGLTGLVERYLPPSMQSKVTGATVYTYDQDKQLTKISRPDGKNIEFIYANDSFLLNTIATPDGDYKFQYASGKNGRTDLLSGIIAPGGINTVVSYVWRLPSAISTVGEVNGTVGYSYNNDMTLGAISLAGADGNPVISNKITYDLDMLPVSVGNLYMTRNSAGAVSGTSLGKIVESIGYNTFGEPISSGFTVDKKPIFGMSYNRDKVGRITASQDVISTTKVVSTYEYDAQGRLSKATKGSETRSYTYDANGNRLSFTSGAKSYSGVYDEQDRLLSYGNAKFEYNENGDLKSRTDVNPDTKEAKTTSYTYDVFGNLRKVVLPDGRVIEYIIDGLNRRVGKKINGKLVQGFIYYNQLQIAAELDGSGKIVKSFVYGSKVNVPDYAVVEGKQYRVISDQVGTPKMIVEAANGKVIEQFNYDEFGVPLDGKVSGLIPFAFAGGLYDGDTGLVRFGARDYDPEVGRWTSRDPSLFNGGMNLYGYSFNDPVNFTDSNGKNPVLVAVGIGAAVGAVANVTGSFFAGTLTRNNFLQTAGIGAFAGGAAVLTAGTAAIATATTLTGILTAEIGSGFVGTLAGAGIDIGLNLLSNPPDPYPTTLQPNKAPLCPQ